MEALVAYSWPGNVRELINVVERAVLLSTGPEIGIEDLPGAIARATSRLEIAPGTPPGAPPWPEHWYELPLGEARQLAQESLDRLYLERVLDATRGRVGDAAAEAGISPRALYALMRRYGLAKERYRKSPRG
jgi:DNA-binding NtrC family response regulator